MNRVMITDEQLRAALDGAAEPIDVCGPDGKMIGYFTPLRLADIPLQISEEELRRREQLRGGRKLADILRDLEKRA